MARFLLLLRRLFGRGMRGGLAALMLGLVVGQAHATGTVPLPITSTIWSKDGNGLNPATCGTATQGCGPTGPAALTAIAVQEQVYNRANGYPGCVVTSGTAVQDDATTWHALITRTSCVQASTTVSVFPKITYGACPTNSTGPTGTAPNQVCSCSSGYSPGTYGLTGLCVPPTTCPAGSTLSTGTYDIGTDITAFPMAGCSGGCGYTYSGLSANGWSLISGVRHYYATGTYVSTGAACGGGTGDPTSAPPPPTAASAPPAPTCPAGQALGYVNGDPTCAPTGAPSPGSTASAPASGVSELKDTTTCTSSTAGTVTTKTCTTTYASGAKGTTTTTTDSSNGSTSTVSTGANSSGGAGAISPGIPASGGQAGGGGGGPGGGCSSNPSAAGCGGSAGGTPSSYEAKDKTFGSVLGARRDQFLGSGVGAATAGFWSVSGTGTCPMSTWSIPYVNATVPFNVMCSSWALDMLDKMKFVVLIVFAWYAFRIALD